MNLRIFGAAFLLLLAQGAEPNEFNFLREQFEQSVDPVAVEDRTLTLEALDDLDRGAECDQQNLPSGCRQGA